MNLSPQDHAAVLEMVAARIADELRAELGGSFAALYCIEMAVAEKMLGLDRRTIRKEIGHIELSSGKHAVRMADLQEFLDKRARKEGRAA